MSSYNEGTFNLAEQQIYVGVDRWSSVCCHICPICSQLVEDYDSLRRLEVDSVFGSACVTFFQVRIGGGLVVVVVAFLLQTGMSDVADPPQRDSAVWGKDTADPSLPPYPEV